MVWDGEGLGEPVLVGVGLGVADLVGVALGGRVGVARPVPLAEGEAEDGGWQ